MENMGEERNNHCILSLIVDGLSGALTGFFALAGACRGAVTGALAGRASDCGLLRGAGLGAIAGAILSLEVLEASRAYWCSEHLESRSSSSMADFVEELLRSRFIEEPFPAAVVAPYHWQVSISNISDELHDAYDEVASKGLSSKSLAELPSHVVVVDEVSPSQIIYCTICLQDVEIGDLVRSLPTCLHTFYLSCVDKWLIRHESCPVCRQNVNV